MPYLKEFRDVRDGSGKKLSWNTSIGWVQPGTSFASPVDSIGTKSYNLLHAYGGPRQLPFSLHPVQHRVFRGASTPCDGKLFTLAWQNNPSIPDCWFKGDLAAAMGGHSAQLTPYGQTAQGKEAAIAAVSKLLAPDVNYGLILAEAKETLDLFTSPARFLLKNLPKLKRPRVLPKGGFFQNAVTYASNAWLQYRYAISPTMSDITDICVKTTEVINPPKKFHRRGGGVEIPGTYSRTSKVVGFLGAYFEVTTSVGFDSRYVSHVFYQITDGAASERNRLGYGLSQIPSLIWEKVPFSFVVDWVVDVGSWLNAVTPTPEYRRLGQTLSLICTSYGGTVVTMGSIYPDMKAASPCASSYVWSEHFYDRAINPTLPALPPVNANILNFVRSVDAASLAWKPITNFVKNLTK